MRTPSHSASHIASAPNGVFVMIASSDQLLLSPGCIPHPYLRSALNSHAPSHPLNLSLVRRLLYLNMGLQGLMSYRAQCLEHSMAQSTHVQVLPDGALQGKLFPSLLPASLVPASSVQGRRATCSLLHWSLDAKAKVALKLLFNP